MSALTFTERLTRFPPVNWQTEPPSSHNGPSLVMPKVVLVEGRSVGVVDGVTAALFLQGIESNRLLLALSDQLLELARELLAGNMREAKTFLERDLTLVLHALHAHIDESDKQVHAAMDAHDQATAKLSGAPH